MPTATFASPGFLAPAMSRRRAAALLLIALTSAACDDDPDGRYELVSVNGEDVPAEVERVGTTRHVVVSGAVELEDDSLIETEHVRLESTTTDGMEQGFHTRAAHGFERDGSIVRGLPDAPPLIDPMFSNCTRAGVYRVEDGGDRLRLIDYEYDGSCEETTTVHERVYVRD